MERAKNHIKDLKVMLSEAVMSEDSVLSLAEIKKVFKTVKLIEGEIDRAEHEKENDIIDIPKLPKGDRYNGFPRIMYATVCEQFSRDKFYSTYDLMALTGSSRTQVKNDLTRLQADGHIELYDQKVSGKTNLYKYKPTNL